MPRRRHGRRKAAEQGNATAQFHLGVAYHLGDVSPTLIMSRKRHRYRKVHSRTNATAHGYPGQPNHQARVSPVIMQRSGYMAAEGRRAGRCCIAACPCLVVGPEVRGVPRDHAEAVTWGSKVPENKAFAKAQAALG